MLIICLLLFKVELQFLFTKINDCLLCIGVSKGIEECQYQFQDRHWNCSILQDGSVFGPVLYHGKSLAFSFV